MSKPLKTSDPTQEVALRMGDDPVSSAEPKIVMKTFQEMCKKSAALPALHQKVLKPGVAASDTPWTTWTFAQYEENVMSFAKSLLSLGFNKFDTVNIIGFNAPEWFFANFGAMAAGGIAAGIYTTNNPEACYYVSDHSKAKVVVVEGAKQLEKYLEIGDRLPNLQAVVVYGETVPEDAYAGKIKAPIYSFEDFLLLGKDQSMDTVQERIDSWKPGETCTLIYTSGTTGNPKAVMITNDNLTWTTDIILTKGALPRLLTNDDNIISYLPLSHIAAQIIDMHCMLQSGNQIWFAQPDALRGSLGATLKEVRPTVFFGVPRVWEKIYAKMQEIAKTVTGLKKKISTFAKSRCKAKNLDGQFGGTQYVPWGYTISSKILHKVKVALGLDRAIACLTGAAPIEREVLEYFASININILELFGQSECTGPHTFNCWDAYKIGTCGRPMRGTESKIDEATGELCYRGRHIFAGYMHMEDKTNETIDEEGWLHSGDVAKFDEHNDSRIKGPSGFMSITGRIKELIITAGGENVAPVLIEHEFKSAMPALANAMVIGDKRKFLTILLALEVEVDGDGVASDKLTGKALETSKEIGSSATTTAEAMTCDKWKKYLDDGMEVANSKVISRAQRIGKWALVPTDFTEKGGELTPTLKLKRGPTEAKYADIIEKLYG